MIDFTARNISNTDWITGVLMLIIFLLGFAKLIHQDKFNKTLLLFTSKKYFLNYGKESNREFNAFSGIMYIVQLLVFSLLGYLVIENLSIGYDLNTELNFPSALFYVTLFFIGKYIIIKLVGIIFKFNKLQNDLTFLKISYLNIIAIYLIPLIAIMVYSQYFSSEFINYSIIYTLFLFLFSYLLILLNNKKIIFNNFFYFILYICTLEIAPLLIVMKLVF